MLTALITSVAVAALASAQSSYIYREIGGGKASYLINTYHKTVESFRANGFMPHVEAAKYERQPQVKRMQDAYMVLSSRAMVIEKLPKALGASDPVVSAEDERAARTRIIAALSTTGPTALGFVSYWPDHIAIEAIAINPLFLEGGEAAEYALLRYVTSLATADSVSDLRLRYAESNFFQLSRALFYVPCGFVGDAETMAQLQVPLTTTIAPASSPPDVTGPAEGSWLPGWQPTVVPETKEQQAQNWQARHYGASGLSMPGVAPEGEVAPGATGMTGGAAAWVEDTGSVLELSFDPTALDEETCSGSAPSRSSTECERRRRLREERWREGGSEGGSDPQRRLREEHRREGGSVQRRLADQEAALQCASARCESEEGWLAEWGARFGCWWDQTPHQEELLGCAGTLSLRLAHRLERVMRTVGIAPRAATLQPAVAAEAGCEWLSEGFVEGGLGLPAFPPLGGFEFALPPLPRLTPWGVRKWQELGGEPLEREAAAPAEDAGQAAVALGVLGGGMATAALSLAWVRWAARGRPQLRARAAAPCASAE